MPQGLNNGLVSPEMKQQLLTHMNPLNELYRIIPYWYANLNELDKNSEKARNLLKLTSTQAKSITSYLDCYTINEIVTFHRHNKQIKPFGVFDEKDILNLRTQGIFEDEAKHFGAKIASLSQDSLSIPRNVFQMAHSQTHITTLDLSNIDGLSEGALVCIFEIMLIPK